MSLDHYRWDPAAFIDDYIPLNEKGKPWRLSPHQRKVLNLAMRWAREGREQSLRLLLWAEMKKSGKTLLAGALGLWWAYTRPNTEVITAANDLEQSVGRVFKTMLDLIKRNPSLLKSAKLKVAAIELTNGTTIIAIASDYKGAAGSRHSLVIFDELWGYSTENAQRLFEELTPPPTEQDAWILVVTYAGFSGESELLERLYQQGIAGERLDDDLEVFWSAGQFTFWSHTPRQPWQTEAYYADQRRTLRPNAFARLHENRWVTGESPFITADLWDACVDPSLTPAISGQQVTVGVDAGIKSDNAAIVAIARREQRLMLVAHRIWRPTSKEPLDIEATIEAYLRQLAVLHQVVRVYYDPYQLHRSATTLRRSGLRMEEYPQNPANLTRMGQNLYELLTGRNLHLYSAPDLRTHALNAVAVESTRGWRIAKEKTSKKIDGCVALAMAAMAAVDHTFKSPGVACIHADDSWQREWWGLPQRPGEPSQALQALRRQKMERALKELAERDALRRVQ